MSIDTPEFWALLNARDEGAMDDAHAVELEQAIVTYIDAQMERDRKDARNAALEEACAVVWKAGGLNWLVRGIRSLKTEDAAIDAELAINNKTEK